MKDKKTGLRKEIILITSIALLIISVTSSGTKLYFSIPSALVCFLCETYGLANRTKNKTYKFIFSVFSPFCFLLLHFWLLYLCKAPSTMMKRAHSSYIIVIVIIALLDIWYSSLISEKVQPPIVQQIDFSEIPAPVENITSDEPGKLIIKKENAYVGSLQRTFKIGFNRATRIMDQLCDAGVIGPENGTKPRKILMSMEEFEEYLKNH